MMNVDISNSIPYFLRNYEILQKLTRLLLLMKTDLFFAPFLPFSWRERLFFVQHFFSLIEASMSFLKIHWKT